MVTSTLTFKTESFRRSCDRIMRTYYQTGKIVLIPEDLESEITITVKHRIAKITNGEFQMTFRLNMEDSSDAFIY